MTELETAVAEIIDPPPFRRDPGHYLPPGDKYRIRKAREKARRIIELLTAPTAEVTPSAPAGEDSEEKQLFREVARDLRPDMTRDQFDHHWERFLVLKAKAEAMKAQGVAIHPTFGLPPEQGA